MSGRPSRGDQIAAQVLARDLDGDEREKAEAVRDGDVEPDSGPIRVGAILPQSGRFEPDRQSADDVGRGSRLARRGDPPHGARGGVVLGDQSDHDADDRPQHHRPEDAVQDRLPRFGHFGRLFGKLFYDFLPQVTTQFFFFLAKPIRDQLVACNCDDDDDQREDPAFFQFALFPGIDRHGLPQTGDVIGHRIHTAFFHQPDGRGADDGDVDFAGQEADVFG